MTEEIRFNQLTKEMKIFAEKLLEYAGYLYYDIDPIVPNTEQMRKSLHRCSLLEFL